MNPQRLRVQEVIQQVRRRILTRRLLQGVFVTLAIAALAVLAAAILAHQFPQRRALLVVLRVLPMLVTLAAGWWFVLRAGRQKIRDSQIARLIEEKYALADRLTTVVEFQEQARDASPAIVNRLIQDADERVSHTDLDQVVDPRNAYAFGAGALVILLSLMAALWWFAPVKGGIAALYSPFDEAVSANALFINVTPPTSRVPHGSDQKIKAALNGFDANVAQIFIRKLSDANWLATAMEPAKNHGEFQHLIFNIQDSIVYYVEANGIRSSEQTLEVVDLPYVKQVDLLLTFPAFTGLSAKTIENGGDIAALKGTLVRVTAILSAQAKAARLVFNDGTKIEMTHDEEMTADNEFHFVGQFTIKQAGTYKIELTSADGERYNGSNEYDITLLADAPPTVVIEKPGRDVKVTNIQEVFTQAKAEDDFGVAALEFFYTVNGGEEQRVALQDVQRDAPKTLSGAHTFFLEEMNLQVGDFISYYAKAKDVTGQESTSDIYFLEVRPFDREFRQSQQQSGEGGGDQDSNALTRKQREIIAATFRVQREEKTYAPPEKDENFGAVALSQEKLKGEADALVERIRRRLGDRLNADPQFSKLVEYVTQASTEMAAAKDKLRAKNTREALPPEQRALQQLLRAEALFREIQVGQQQGQGGGGQQQEQRELADLFELQLDKMKNQYESVQRQQQQAQSQQEDEVARKLQELAQRQQKELEQRMRSQMQQQGGGGQGGSQRQQQEMIEEAQRMARELERLSRDRRDPKMQQAAEQLRQAAEEMKRAQALSSASLSQAAQQEAAAQTQRALQRLEQARRMLNSSQQAGGQQSVQQLRQRAEDAMRRQHEIAKSVEELAKNGQAAGDDKKQQLGERKQTLAEQVAGLEKDIDQAARSLGADKQQAADKLRDAANAIRRNRIPERIRQNNQLIDNNYFAQAGEREKGIKDNLEEVVKNLQAAESNANRRQSEGMEEALNRARELADNLESMRRRMEQGGGDSQQNQNGQQGQQQGRQQSGQQQGQQANQQGNQQGQQGLQQGRQQSSQQGRQQGSQQGRQQGNQQGSQPGRQPQGNQQSRGQQSGQQAGGQQSNGQSQGNQRGQQQGGQQQGQQGSQQGSQQGQQQGQQAQQGGQAQGGQSGGQQPRGGQQQSNQGLQQSGEQQMQGSGRPSSSSNNRQGDSELRQRLEEAQELRRALKGNNDLTRDLDQAIEQLRRINPNAFQDPAQLALLKSEVIDPLRQLEVELARRLQAKQGNSGIGSLSDGDAPDRYRKLIEDYYRRLSSRSASSKP
ncbi:MAG: hypothetical protein HY231_01650 [Acidobacteria bacterium]|nr:hypothetical protein [Acidobacteriota bacterium]